MPYLPTTADAHALAEVIAGIACPFERVAAFRPYTKDNGNLPSRLAKLRTTALIECRDDRKALLEDIAEHAGLTIGRVSTLLSTPLANRIRADRAQRAAATKHQKVSTP